MTALFWALADAAFAAGWVVMALCLFRLLCRNYLPRWLTAAMWLLVAVRLVCPFSVESEASILPSPLSYTVNTYLEQTDTPTAPDETPTVESDAPISEPVVTEPIPDTPAVSWEAIACGVWLVGVIAMLGYMAVSYTRLQHSVYTATRRDGNVYECETVESPFILGIIRPRIYLPYAMNGADRESALAHERAHIARGDHIWKFAAFLLLSVYWFHPLLWLAYYLFCRDIEFACDERVIKALSQEERKTYSRALLSSAVSRRRAVMCPLAFGEVGVEARVKGVIKYKKPLRVLVVIALIACVIMSWKLITDPPAPSQATLENAHIYFQLESEELSEADSLLVETGNRITLHGDSPLQLQIESVDTDDMTVTLSCSQTLYDGIIGMKHITVGMQEQRLVYTAPHSGGSELRLALSLPSAVTEVDEKRLCETVYRGDGVTLRLYEEYYCLQFDGEDGDGIIGSYEQTANTLTLTQDAHLSQYVLHADGDCWRYDADASYRHKLAASPALADGAELTFFYHYEATLVNQHYTYTIENARGEELLAGYSAFGVKPVIEELSDTALKVTDHVPASAPKPQSRTLDLTTGEYSGYSEEVAP